MIIEKPIIMTWNPSNREWYISKGHIFTKWFDEFELKSLDDLSKSSQWEIDFICDYCGEKHIRTYKRYKSIYKNDKTGKHSCDNCHYYREQENELILLARQVDTNKGEVYHRIVLEDGNEVYIKQCDTCGKYKEVSCFRNNNKSKIINYLNKCIECEQTFRDLSKNKLIKIKTTSNKMNLPVPMTEREYDEIGLRFKNECALSGNINTVYEHFIPVSWGHGGTYIGNIYLLSQNLNTSKSERNPFEWIKKYKSNRGMMKKWRRLVAYLASKNKLTNEEFEKFVYWCEKHKRTIDQIKKDGKSSLELWKESLK